MTLCTIKNTEGYDCVPQRMLADGIDILIDPFTMLFNKINHKNAIANQRSNKKTIPVIKNKGAKNNIESYIPTANLCSASKVFEKWILKRIPEVPKEN